MSSRTPAGSGRERPAGGGAGAPERRGAAPAMDRVERFESLLAAGRESPMLRLTLGTEYLDRSDPGSAIRHLARAVELDPHYSAAWQHLGRAFELAERPEEAGSAWRSGIDAADRRGDAQAAKVMRVWLRRLERRAARGP